MNENDPIEEAELQKGRLVAIRDINNPFAREDDFPSGTIGVFMGYPKGAKNFLPGLEPIEVLIEGVVVRLYRDEITVID